MRLDILYTVFFKLQFFPQCCHKNPERSNIVFRAASPEEILEKGVHYVEVALNEIPLFIRKGKCIPVAEAAECVAALDTKNMQLLGYEGAEYTLYEDDGVHKDYDREENYRVLKK